MASAAECPECGGEVSFEDDVLAGEITQCPDCGVELEVVNKDPLKLEKAPEEEGAEASYEVVEPPAGATVPYVPEGAVEKKVDGETYFVAGTTYYKAFYSGSDVVYMVTANPEG